MSGVDPDADLETGDASRARSTRDRGSSDRNQADDGSGVRVLDPEYGVLGPVAIPGSIGAVGVAAGLATANPVALAVGGTTVGGGLVVGGAYAVGRALNDWPRTVESARVARGIVVENRPAATELRRAVRWTLLGTALFLGGLVPLEVVARATRTGSFGLGLLDELTWILAVALLACSVLASFVGARTVGRGLDRLLVQAAREWVYRRDRLHDGVPGADGA